eukprot:jgi/Galph1/3561/GphlegSOOS_G2230.1
MTISIGWDSNNNMLRFTNRCTKYTFGFLQSLRIVHKPISSFTDSSASLNLCKRGLLHRRNFSVSSFHLTDHETYGRGKNFHGSDAFQMKTSREEKAQRTLLKIQGIVEKVVYRQRETGFCILDIRIHASSLRLEESVIQVVGSFGNVVEGEEFQCSGFLTTHPKYGKQLRAIESNKSSSSSSETSKLSSSERHQILIEKVIFSAPDDSGFAVVQARFTDLENKYYSVDEPGSEKVTIVGKLGRPEEGMNLSIEGVWVNHSKYGKQFQVTSVERDTFDDSY